MAIQEVERQRRVEVIGKLTNAYGALFSWKNPKPLAIGMKQQIATSGVLTDNETNIALKFWVRRPKYKAALSRPGAVRYDLDGTVWGPVAPEDQRQHKKKAPMTDATTEPKMGGAHGDDVKPSRARDSSLTAG